ncbi:hypothetical protein NWQ33_00500 [Mycoplasmopsis cynos]|nr:hypothetical protein [Mycoplasmopsis cynos]
MFSYKGDNIQGFNDILEADSSLNFYYPNGTDEIFLMRVFANPETDGVKVNHQVIKLYDGTRAYNQPLQFEYAWAETYLKNKMHNPVIEVFATRWSRCVLINNYCNSPLFFKEISIT